MDHYEWTMGPGECERCGAYVPQLVRFRGVAEGSERNLWLCDECMEAFEDEL